MSDRACIRRRELLAFLGIALAGCRKPAPPPPIDWQDLASGEAKARAERRLAVVFFFAAWSKGDVMLARETFADLEVRSLLRDAVMIMVDITAENDPPEVHRARERFKVIGTPTVVVIDWAGERDHELLRIVDFEQAPVFARRLREMNRLRAARSAPRR